MRGLALWICVEVEGGTKFGWCWYRTEVLPQSIMNSKAPMVLPGEDAIEIPKMGMQSERLYLSDNVSLRGLMLLLF